MPQLLKFPKGGLTDLMRLPHLDPKAFPPMLVIDPNPSSGCHAELDRVLCQGESDLPGCRCKNLAAYQNLCPWPYPACP